MSATILWEPARPYIFSLAPKYLHVLLFICFHELMSQVDLLGVTLNPLFFYQPSAR